MATFREMIENRVEKSVMEYMSKHTNYGDPVIDYIDMNDDQYSPLHANTFSAYVGIAWDGIANRERFTGIGKHHIIYGLIDGYGDVTIVCIISRPRPMDVDLVEGDRLLTFDFDFIYGRDPNKK